MMFKRCSVVIVDNGMKQAGAGCVYKLRNYEAFGKLLKTPLFFDVSDFIPFHM